MTRNTAALFLLMCPIAVALLAAAGECGKAGNLPTSVDDRICPSPWIGAKPTSAAWYASGICGTVASDSSTEWRGDEPETERSNEQMADPDTSASERQFGCIESPHPRTPYASAGVASPRANDVETSATEAELEAAGCPPDFLYVYGPCEHEDDFGEPIGRAAFLPTAQWSIESDHGYCYDPRLLDDGTWYDPYAWLYPEPAKIASVRAFGPQAPQKRQVIQGDLSWLVELCVCDASYDPGLWINLQNDGLAEQTTRPGRTILATQNRADGTSEPTGYDTVIDGPNRYLFVRRTGPKRSADAQNVVSRRRAHPTDTGFVDEHSRSEPVRPLLAAASDMFKAAGQIALDVSRALEDLNREIAADQEHSGEVVPRTAVSPGDRSRQGVTTYLGL